MGATWTGLSAVSGPPSRQRALVVARTDHDGVTLAMGIARAGTSGHRLVGPPHSRNGIRAGGARRLGTTHRGAMWGTASRLGSLDTPYRKQGFWKLWGKTSKDAMTHRGGPFVYKPQALTQVQRGRY